MTVLELVPLRTLSLRGEKHFKPRPENRILIPLRVFFQNFRQALYPGHFYMFAPLPGDEALFQNEITNELKSNRMDF